TLAPTTRSAARPLLLTALALGAVSGIAFAGYLLSEKYRKSATPSRENVTGALTSNVAPIPSPVASTSEPTIAPIAEVLPSGSPEPHKSSAKRGAPTKPTSQPKRADSSKPAPSKPEVPAPEPAKTTKGAADEVR